MLNRQYGRLSHRNFHRILIFSYCFDLWKKWDFESQFWIHNNFSETVQDIQSAGLDNLIAMITVAYSKTTISKKGTGFVAIREFKRDSTRTIKTLLW